MSALLAGMTATTFAAKSFVAAPSLSSPTNPTVFARFTIIAGRRRAFEPTLPLFQFFYRRGSVVEGVGRRARQLGRFAFMLNDARVHSALNLLQKWKCIPGVREHIYALVNCPVDLLCSPRCESRAACEAKRKLLHHDRFRVKMTWPLSVAHSIRTSKGWTSSSIYACISVTKYSCGLFSTLDYSSIIHFRRRFAYSRTPGMA